MGCIGLCTRQSEERARDVGRRAVLAHPEKTPASRAAVDTDAISLIASDATVFQLK